MVNLFTGESSRALFGGDAPSSVNHLLHEAAAWQGLGDVRVEGVGTWAAPLALACG